MRESVWFSSERTWMKRDDRQHAVQEPQGTVHPAFSGQGGAYRCDPFQKPAGGQTASAAPVLLAPFR